VRELAMGPVDLAPLLEQGQDLFGLLGQDAVHRGPAWRGVGELAAGPAGVPAVRTDLADLEHPASPTGRPTCVDGRVDQVQQAGLGGRIDPTRDPATQPQPSFPSTSVSFTASSLQASDNRAISAFAASSS
jgi:hypothetical protein